MIKLKKNCRFAFRKQIVSMVDDIKMPNMGISYSVSELAAKSLRSSLNERKATHVSDLGKESLFQAADTDRTRDRTQRQPLVWVRAGLCRFISVQ